MAKHLDRIGVGRMRAFCRYAYANDGARCCRRDRNRSGGNANRDCAPYGKCSYCNTRTAKIANGQPDRSA